ncbi:MAG: DUF309 domain-containing protein [Chthoniobacteraceae bacterium]
MKKSDRIRDFVSQLGAAPAEGLDARYAGYFACFNAGRYYEAHDVLEDLWLSEPGADAAFFKGLIQFAGAFVHLQKQHARPDHPKDGRRLAPASRLFALALRNLAPFEPEHLRLDVSAVVALAAANAAELIASDFTRNPWHPDHAPQMTLR